MSTKGVLPGNLIELGWIREKEGGAPVQPGSGATWDRWDPALRLGREAYVSSAGKVQSLNEEPTVTIRPGEFALLMTEEWIDLPDDVVAFISVKSKYKSIGLLNVSGFHVDPGYQGYLIFAVYNAGSTAQTLRKGDKIFMIIFERLPKSEKRRSDQTTHKQIPADWITSLQGPTVSLPALQEQVQSLQTVTKILQAVVVGLVLAVIGAGLALLAKQ